MYCALSSIGRSLVSLDSTAAVYDRLLVGGKRDHFQRYDREDDEQERKIVGAGKRTCPLWCDHDAYDFSVLETNRRSLYHNDVIIW